MDWQQLVALIVVGFTVGIFAWSRFRPRRFSFERDTHCGCGCAAGALGPQHSVVYRARKGERPEIIVKIK